MSHQQSQIEKKAELQRRVEKYRERASEKALMTLLEDSESASAAESIWLSVTVAGGREYSFALKPVPVKLTYCATAHHHQSVQQERYQPSALVPAQEISWAHTAVHMQPGRPAGGATVSCTVVRTNKARNAEAPLRQTAQGILRWQNHPTRLCLQGNGWIFQFHYSQHDGKLRLVDAEYDTNMGEEAIRSMQQMTAAPQTGKRKTKAEENDEAKLAIEEYNRQKHTIANERAPKRPRPSDEEEEKEEGEDEEDRD